MAIGGIDNVRRVLGTLESRAGELARLGVPEYFGRTAALERATTLVSQAVADATRASTLLGETGGSLSAVADIERAAQALGSVPIEGAPLRAAGADLAASTRAALAGLDASAPPIDEATRLRQLDPGELSPDDWSSLQRLVDADPSARSVRIPRTLEDAHDLDAWLPGLADGSFENNGDLDRYFAAWRVAESSAGELRSLATSLRDRTPSEYAARDWHDLAALVAHDTRGRFMTGPRTLEGAHDLEAWLPGLASGKFEDNGDLARYLRAWQATDAGDDAVRSVASDLRRREVATYTTDDWTRLLAAVDVDPRGRVVTIPRTLEGANDLDAWLPGLVTGKYENNGELDRYVAAWRVASAKSDPAALRTSIDGFRTKDVGTFTQDDWARFAALVDADPTGRIVTIPRSLDGAHDLDAWLPGLATGKYENNGELDRYFAAWRLSELDRGGLREAAAALRDKDVGTFTTEDWSRLAALVDVDPAGRTVTIPRSLDGAHDLDTWLDGLVTGKYENNGELDRYIEAWRLADLDADGLRAAATEFRPRDVGTFTRSDWTRLAALVDVDPNGRTVTIPRSLEGAHDLDAWLNGLVTGKYENDGELDRYMEAWRLADAPPAQLRSGAMSLIERHPDSLTSTEWGRLSALLDADPEGRVLTGPRSLDGHHDLTAWLPGLSTGKYQNNGELDRYFDAWRVQLDPAYAQRVDTAIDAVAKGSVAAGDVALVGGQAHRLAELVSGRPLEEQAALATAMIQQSSVASNRGVRGTLEVLDGSLRELQDLPPQLATLRDSTVELVQRNLARLDGATPDGAVQGYSNHPDYAEVGRIRSNVELIQRARAAAASPTTAAADAAIPLSEAGTDAATPAAGGERLTW